MTENGEAEKLLKEWVEFCAAATGPLESCITISALHGFPTRDRLGWICWNARDVISGWKRKKRQAMAETPTLRDFTGLLDECVDLCEKAQIAVNGILRLRRSFVLAKMLYRAEVCLVVEMRPEEISHG